MTDCYPLWCFNTASGKYCCNAAGPWVALASAIAVSIPQAVSTVATFKNSATTPALAFVSIPQAVSTVATFEVSFFSPFLIWAVSIPQAVSTVATNI